MLTKLEVRNSNVSIPPLPISNSMGPIQIRDIDGLGPVTATVNSTKYAEIDGEEYTGSTLPKRNIVLKLGFNPDWATQTMTDLRHALYQYFMTKQKVNLRFYSDELPTVEINGVVESFEPNLFSKDPEIVISIVCTKPDFVDLVATVVPGVALALPDGAATIINYSGSVETGFLLNVVASVAAPTLNGEVDVINTVGGDTIVFGLTVQINSTKYLQLSTLQGFKYAKTIPTGVGSPVSILGDVFDETEWAFYLQPGVNHFRVLSATPGQTWDLHYYNRYGGL